MELSDLAKRGKGRLKKGGGAGEMKFHGLLHVPVDSSQSQVLCGIKTERGEEKEIEGKRRRKGEKEESDKR